MEHVDDLKVDSSTITRNVYDKLFNAIVTGYFKPGERLTERQLAHDMGISRTPIREAFRELHRQKLVLALPYKGVEVIKPSKQESLDIIEICILLEGFIAELAAKNSMGKTFKDILDNLNEYKIALNNKNFSQMKALNHEFHEMIASYSENNYAIDIYLNIRALMSLISEMTIECSMRAEETYIEHKNIYLAIKQGDAIKAKEEATYHIKKVKELFLNSNT